MFKKPLSDMKTSAPLRNSDRRKLRQRVAQRFALDTETSDLLVPDGLLSMKYKAHQGAPGLLYLSADGSPLWFTVGRDSEELIPSVYTLWKHPTLLPFISTPAAVIPVLVGGADLMIPGVVQRPMSLKTSSLVGVSQYQRGARGPPLAVGQMAVDAEQITENGVTKGKAVTVLHTWKDHLWLMGAKGNPPDFIPLDAGDIQGRVSSDDGDEDNASSNAVDPEAKPTEGDGEAIAGPPSEIVPPQQPEEGVKLSPEDVSSLLRTSLLQALQTSLSSLPLSAFPMPASTLYASHILPARPAYPENSSPVTPIDIKHSAFKSLSVLLRQAEKQSLLKLKDSKSDVVVTAVSPAHPDVVAHRRYLTVGEQEVRRKKDKERAGRMEQEPEEDKGKSMSVLELWKPRTSSTNVFQDLGKDTSALYVTSDVRTTLEAYITKHDLVNRAEQQYINVGSDELLRTALYPSNGKYALQPPEFAKREELVTALCQHMQAWYRIQVGAGESVTKKGQLQPISVVVKIRQGRKACTLITGFETFFLSSDTLADALRARCASATSVSQVAGRAAGEEVMVQGKQIKPVVDFLLGSGVPKKWIVATDITDKKKKQS